MTINEQLTTIGLKRSEIRVYLYILEQGIVTPPKIAAGTGIARTNCYHILDNLRDRGLIVEQPKGKRKSYLARDPEALLTILEQQRSVMQQLLPGKDPIF